MVDNSDKLTKDDIFWLYIIVVVSIFAFHISFPVVDSKPVYFFKQPYNVSDYIVIDGFKFFPDKIPASYEYYVLSRPLDIHYQKVFILKDFSNIKIEVDGKAQFKKGYLFSFVKEFGANYSIQNYVQEQLDNIFSDINNLTISELIERHDYYRNKVNNIKFKCYDFKFNVTIRKTC